VALGQDLFICLERGPEKLSWLLGCLQGLMGDSIAAVSNRLKMSMGSSGVLEASRIYIYF
jgi:hypothetical protein